MSETTHVFVDTQTPLSEFVAEVRSWLNIQLTRVSDKYEVWYRYENEEIAVTLGFHDYVNDRDMDFEQFRYDICVRARRDKIRVRFARYIFDTLQAKTRYRLMLVDHLQVMLAKTASSPST